MLVRKMRLLRHKYNISRNELAEECGLSPQRISEIELGEAALSLETKKKLERAFSYVHYRRLQNCSALREDLFSNLETLFDPVEETIYEL